jgi:erythromycin esterase-like protein
MGYYLDRMFGNEYRAFGIMSFGGSYTAVQSMWGGPRGLVLVEAFPAPVGSLEEAFNRVSNRMETEIIVTDLRPALEEAGGRMLLEGRPYRFVGYAAEDYGFSGSVELARQFDGLFFIRRTTGTRPIGISPWPRF